MRLLSAKNGLIVLLLTVGIFLSTAAAAAEENRERNFNVKLDLPSATVKSVSESITRQTGFVFSYDNAIAGCNLGKVEINARKSGISDILSRIFGPAGISFRIVDRVIVLTRDDSLQDGRSGDIPLFQISGRVTDEDGEPLAGVSVIVHGSNTGTETDASGRYALDVRKGDLLVYSILGFHPHQEVAGLKDIVNVTMAEESLFMDEVVVVGYGTSRKRDITGAVSNLGGSEITDRPNTDVTRSIQGMVPGLNIVQTDGKATHSGELTIRGTKNTFKARVTDGQKVNTLGQGGDVLILIDGAEGELGSLNPDDIASISVLKDAASAAIYGARGALGVILITTRNPDQGRPKVTYNGSVSLNRRTVLWENNVVTDPVAWVDAWSEAYMNSSNRVPDKFNNYMSYSKSWYDCLLRKYREGGDIRDCVTGSGGNYEYYGSTNWLAEIYKKVNVSTTHSITVQGGKEGVDYYVSGRYYGHDGIYKVGNENLRKYNFRAKGSLKIFPWLTLSNNASLISSRYHQPMVHTGQQIISRMVDLYAYPFATITNPDGTWTAAAAKSGFAAFADESSWQENNNLKIANIASLTADIVQDVLRVTADFTYKAARWSRDRLENLYRYYTGEEVSGYDRNEASLENWTYRSDYISSSIAGTFSPRLGDGHKFLAMAGWNIENEEYHGRKVYRTSNQYISKPEFSALDGEYYSTASEGYSWGLAGFFSRLKYSWKDRYLVEANMRYDGSSKFPENSRWGFFPSASAGWRISREKWMGGPGLRWLNDLKLRFSAGSLGNANIDPYQYVSTMPSVVNTSILLNGSRRPYTTAPSLIPDDITWEKVSTYNAGLDLSALRNRLSVTADYYNKISSDLYTVGPALPQVLGSSAPYGNYACLKTKGWELSVSWKDHFNVGGRKLTYSVKGMLWDNRSRITSYYNATGDLTTYYKGMEIGEIWGFATDGIYASNAEADAGPDYSFFKNGDWFKAFAGDLKFRDLNGDGKISAGSRTLDDHGDLTIIGNTSPRYMYSFNLSLNWNGIGLSMFWQGVGKRDWYPWTESGFFWGKWNRAYNSLMKSQTGDNRVKIDKSSDNWVVTNMDRNPYWTRLVALAANRNYGPLTWENDHYLQDASYIRLKNVTLDYTLPERVSERMGFSRMRIYFSGENVFTWSPMFRHTDMFDPEALGSGDTDFSNTTKSGLNGTGNGYVYPMLKVFTLGVNLTF